MFENEYNPVHVHQGSLFTGLSSVMILKLPQSFGVEYSSPDAPQNGRLQILGSTNGQFANIDYQPDIKERDFFIFPYDMRHCVYPFNGEFLSKVSTRIINEVKGINRVVYDTTSKPPGTIEWE